MCFGVRFSLYLASCLPDFYHFFSVCVVLGGGDNVGTRKKGGDQPKKRGGLVPLFPPPPLDPPMHGNGVLYIVPNELFR